MKALASLAAIAAAMAVASPAAAELYGSAGYSIVNSNDDIVDVQLGAITARGGSKLTENFGVEVEGSFGVSDDTATIEGVDVDVGLNWGLGAYLVGFLPLGENFELLGRVGVATAEVEAEAGGYSVSDTGSGFEVGAGAQFFFVPNHGIRLDYTHSEAIDADTVTLSYTFRFGE